jgi:NADH:ubiquinone oxidoreductase subunit E
MKEVKDMDRLNQKALDTITDIVARHNGRLGPVKLMLHDVQHELGYIPFEAMEKISLATGASVAEVYGVVTFYTQFTLEPKGKHVINICMGTACYVKGAQELLNRVVELTKAPVNGTSEDKVFSVDATRCLGACGLAPVAIIDGRVYGNATQSKMVEEFIRFVVEQETKTKREERLSEVVS